MDGTTDDTAGGGKVGFRTVVRGVRGARCRGVMKVKAHASCAESSVSIFVCSAALSIHNTSRVTSPRRVERERRAGSGEREGAELVNVSACRMSAF